jgi:hypothetical protein
MRPNNNGKKHAIQRNKSTSKVYRQYSGKLKAIQRNINTARIYKSTSRPSQKKSTTQKSTNTKQTSYNINMLRYRTMGKRKRWPSARWGSFDFIITRKVPYQHDYRTYKKYLNIPNRGHPISNRRKPNKSYKLTTNLATVTKQNRKR